MRYYIADCHFWHEKLLTQMDHRPFESVEQMNEVMIEKWNRKVRKNDDVVILGDFSWGNGEQTNEILERLNGRKYLIVGNHDLYLKDRKFQPDHFVWIREYAELRDNRRKVVLSHYPMVCYNGQYRKDEQGEPKSWMLYGHVHDTQDQRFLESYERFISVQTHRSLGDGSRQPVPLNMINCFCMYSDYTPLSLDEWISLDAQIKEKGQPVLPEWNEEQETAESCE